MWSRWNGYRNFVQIYDNSRDFLSLFWGSLVFTLLIQGTSRRIERSPFCCFSVWMFSSLRHSVCVNYSAYGTDIQIENRSAMTWSTHSCDGWLKFAWVCFKKYEIWIWYFPLPAFVRLSNHFIASYFATNMARSRILFRIVCGFKLAYNCHKARHGGGGLVRDITRLCDEIFLVFDFFFRYEYIIQFFCIEKRLGHRLCG